MLRPITALKKRGAHFSKRRPLWSLAHNGRFAKHEPREHIELWRAIVPLPGFAKRGKAVISEVFANEAACRVLIQKRDPIRREEKPWRLYRVVSRRIPKLMRGAQFRGA